MFTLGRFHNSSASIKSQLMGQFNTLSFIQYPDVGVTRIHEIFCNFTVHFHGILLQELLRLCAGAIRNLVNALHIKHKHEILDVITNFLGLKTSSQEKCSFVVSNTHGKRSSSNPGEGRSITPTLQPALPRPLLDILLDALSSATRPGAQSAAHSQFRQRIPSDFAAANAATRALLLEDVNEAGARAMADGNEDSGSFAYAPNGQETEDAVFVFSPVEDYSEARYRRDAGNASAKDVVFAKDETLPKDSELEEKEGEDVALEVTRDGKRRMSTRAAQPRRIVDLHILANWVRR
nr:uncharacterized protein LOC113801805 [Penaeus vannamei]